MAWCKYYMSAPDEKSIHERVICSGVGIWKPCKKFKKCLQLVAKAKEESTPGSMEKIVAKEPPTVVPIVACQKNGEKSQSGQTTKLAIKDESAELCPANEHTAPLLDEC